jgi:hypothetical protein
METPKSSRAAHLVDDLVSIRELLSPENEPPLLTDSLDPSDIPVLSEVVMPGPEPRTPSNASQAFRAAAEAAAIAMQAQHILHPPVASAAGAFEPDKVKREMHAAAQLILQDVVDDFVPQIEAELKRRLEARLHRLLNDFK